MKMTIRCMKVFNIYAEKCYNLIVDKQPERKKTPTEKIRDVYRINQEIGKSPKCINQSKLARDLDVSQAMVSKELKKLINAGIIKV